MGVCAALNSAADHQEVVIHAAMVWYRHGTYIFEGTGREPCPGWPKRFFTAPANIPLNLGRYPGLLLNNQLFWDLMDFCHYLGRLHKANPSSRQMVTIRGVIIRKALPLIYRSWDGGYIGWGEGIDGGNAAMLVVTSVPILDP